MADHATVESEVQKWRRLVEQLERMSERIEFKLAEAQRNLAAWETAELSLAISAESYLADLSDTGRTPAQMFPDMPREQRQSTDAASSRDRRTTGTVSFKDPVWKRMVAAIRRYGSPIRISELRDRMIEDGMFEHKGNKGYNALYANAYRLKNVFELIGDGEVRLKEGN